MKTYFPFEGHIRSQELTLAMSLLSGVGAQCGFGDADIDGVNNTLKVYPKPSILDDTKPGIKDMADRITRRRMVKPSYSGEGSNTNFVCVARDGAIFSSDQEEISGIKIRGTKGMLNEVFLFAVHTPIDEPIDNPVEFVACWNESSTEYYSLYRQTLDPYYPVPKDKRVYDINKHSPYIDKYNFTALENSVISASEYYANNLDNAVLIAIYGTGTNTDDGSSRIEKFTIIPYKSQFPQPIPFNLMEKKNINSSIENLERLTKGFFGESIKAYIDSSLKKIKEEVSQDLRMAALPIGSIILWEGSEIPKGWAEYTKASGRIIVGYKVGGIKVQDNLVLQENGDMYNPVGGSYEVVIDHNNLPKHKHSIGISKGYMDNATGRDRSVVQNFTNRDTNLNGDFGGSGATINIQSGAISSSYNLIGESKINETNHDKLVIEKLPPAVTLKYIIKIS